MFATTNAQLYMDEFNLHDNVQIKGRDGKFQIYGFDYESDEILCLDIKKNKIERINALLIQRNDIDIY